MRLVFRLASCVALFLLLWLGLSAWPECPGRSRAGFWDLLELFQAMEQGREEGAKLDLESRAVLRTIRAKGQLVERVIEGRLSLFEAAARFRALSVARPRFDWLLFRGQFEEVTEEAVWCRAIIEEARTLLAETQRDGGGVVSRLEGELRQALQTGSLRLPTVPETTTPPAVVYMD